MINQYKQQNAPSQMLNTFSHSNEPDKKSDRLNKISKKKFVFVHM